MKSEDSSQGTGEQSGWEVADNVASGVGTAVRGVGWVMVKIYALVLIAVGILVFVVAGDIWWGGLMFLAYVLYLLFGGSWVIW